MDIHIEDLDTKEEIHFAWYLEELKKWGYIVGYDNHPYTFDLFEGNKFKAIKKSNMPKTKPPKVEERELLPKDTYTPDFAIYWRKKAEGIFYEVIGGFNPNHWVVIDRDTPFFVYYPSNIKKDNGIFRVFRYPENTAHISLVDVKPNIARKFAKNISSVYTFPIEQKWVMDKYGVYVQKVVAEGKATCLFAKTFTPERYLTTDKSGAERNIHHKTPTIGEYVGRKIHEYERIRKRAKEGYNPKGVLFDIGNSETS